MLMTRIATCRREQAQLADESDAYKRSVSYWKQQLAFPPSLLQLPLGKPRPAVSQAEAATITTFMLTADRVSALKRLAASLGSSAYAVFVALYRYDGTGGGRGTCCRCSSHLP